MSLSWVDSSGVMGAYVEHDNGVVLASVQVLLHALKVQTFSLSIVIAAVLPLVANKVGDGSVNGPSLVGDQEVNVLVRVPLGEESETKAESSSSRDGLGSSDSVLLAGAAVLAIGKSQALLDVGVDTLDGSVLVIHVALKDELFSAPHARENEWLTVIVSVGSHAQEDLLGAGLLLEGIVETEDGIRGSGSQARPGREASCALADKLTVGTLDEASEHC